MDELRKAAGTAVDVWDDTGTRHEDVVNAMNDLRKVLAKNANAAPQQTVSVGEINEAWKVFRVWFGNTDWTVADAANYRIMFGHGYNFGAARNTAPVAAPQREWQGIADTDFPSIRYGDRSYWAGAKWAENLLRTRNEEKNHE